MPLLDPAPLSPPPRSDTAPRSGVLAALWLPADSQGRLLRPQLARHLGWLRRQGVHGILALGSTGEFVRMSLAEREAMLAVVMELAAPLPVVVNITSIRLDEVVALGRAARRFGAAGVAIMPPYFYPVSQADMLEFFLRAAEAVDLPFYLYNFPELTGNRIDLETAAAFSEGAAMAGIKQSGGEFGYHHDLVRLGDEKGFSVFSGSDTRLPEVFAIGAKGAIGGLANIVPDLMVSLHAICRLGRPGDPSVAAGRMQALGRVIDRMKFPLNVAAGLEARGFEPGAPKTVVSETSRALYASIVQELRELFDAWGLPRA